LDYGTRKMSSPTSHTYYINIFIKTKVRNKHANFFYDAHLLAIWLQVCAAMLSVAYDGSVKWLTISQEVP